MSAPDLAELRRLAEAATPGPWVRGWWSAQAESECNCAQKGALLGKRPQSEYPGAGPFHVHESDFFPDEHRISGQPPECDPVAGNYDYDSGGIVEETDAAFIAALSPSTMLAMLDELAASRALAEAVEQLFDEPEFQGHERCDPADCEITRLFAALAAVRKKK